MRPGGEGRRCLRRHARDDELGLVRQDRGGEREPPAVHRAERDRLPGPSISTIRSPTSGENPVVSMSTTANSGAFSVTASLSLCADGLPATSSCYSSGFTPTRHAAWPTVNPRRSRSIRSISGRRRPRKTVENSGTCGYVDKRVDPSGDSADVLDCRGDIDDGGRGGARARLRPRADPSLPTGHPSLPRCRYESPPAARPRTPRVRGGGAPRHDVRRGRQGHNGLRQGEAWAVALQTDGKISWRGAWVRWLRLEVRPHPLQHRWNPRRHLRLGTARSRPISRVSATPRTPSRSRPTGRSSRQGPPEKGPRNGKFALARYNTDGEPGPPRSAVTAEPPRTSRSTPTTPMASPSSPTGGSSRREFRRWWGQPAVRLIRYNIDGTLDATFGGDGKVKTDFTRGFDGAYASPSRPTGRSWQRDKPASVPDEKFALARYNAHGVARPELQRQREGHNRFQSF